MKKYLKIFCSKTYVDVIRTRMHTHAHTRSYAHTVCPVSSLHPCRRRRPPLRSGDYNTITLHTHYIILYYIIYQLGGGGVASGRRHDDVATWQRAAGDGYGRRRVTTTGGGEAGRRLYYYYYY